MWIGVQTRDASCGAFSAMFLLVSKLEMKKLALNFLIGSLKAFCLVLRLGGLMDGPQVGFVVELAAKGKTALSISRGTLKAWPHQARFAGWCFCSFAFQLMWPHQLQIAVPLCGVTAHFAKCIFFFFFFGRGLHNRNLFSPEENEMTDATRWFRLWSILFWDCQPRVLLHPALQSTGTQSPVQHVVSLSVARWILCSGWSCFKFYLNTRDILNSVEKSKAKMLERTSIPCLIHPVLICCCYFLSSVYVSCVFVWRYFRQQKWFSCVGKSAVLRISLLQKV